MAEVRILPRKKITATSLMDAAKLGGLLHTQWQLGLGGAVVANPIPMKHELDPQAARQAIDQTLTEAAEKGIQGKEVTPFLLARVQELTGGESLRANRELIASNARVGALLAGELARLNR